MNLKIICVEFENLKQFENKKFRVDFIASDRVLKKSELFKLSSNVATQNIIGFIGLNATGKTTSLRLLKTALEIVIRNTDLNSAITSDLIVDDTIIRTTFFYNNKYHQLESVIGIHDDTDKFKFYYKKETLKHKKASTFYSRTELTDFTNAEVENRSDLQNNVAKYLDESKSIVSPTIKGNNCYISDNLWMNYANPIVLSSKAPAEILDFNILNRKDNIYITRKKNFLLSVRKFSDDFKRNDFKKSEIILSNLLTGTAPKYEAIERLRDFVCNQVRWMISKRHRYITDTW